MFSEVVSRVRTSRRDTQTRKAAMKRSRLRNMISVQSLEDRRLLAVLDPIETAAIGTVFGDVNANGVRDAGEEGLNGVFAQLTNVFTGATVVAATSDVDLDENGSIDPATETGIWQFFNLPPNELHSISVLTPAGSATTTSDLGSIGFLLEAGEAIVSQAGQAARLGLDEIGAFDPYNIGVAYEGSIHGFKFEDINGNGVQDPGEPGIQGVSFELTGRDAFGFEVGPIGATTDANGEFAFLNLFPSVNGEVNPNGELDGDFNPIVATGYTITELVPFGFVPTTPTVFTTDLLSGQELVWADGAANLPAAPEAIIDQTQLSLNDNNSSIIFDQGLGAQTFQPGITGNLLRVDIRLTESISADVAAELPAAPQPLTGLRLEIQAIDQFGMPSGVVLGRVDLAEVDINPGTVDGVDDLISFDFSGADLPLLADTTYALVLSASQSLGTVYQWTAETPGPYGRGVALTSSDLGVTYNEFGQDTDFVFRTVMIPFVDPREEVLIAAPLVFGNINATSSLSGVKIFDTNGNGIREFGEQGLAGIEISLTGTNILGQPVNLVTTTDANGNYRFDNLVPSDAAGYTVTEANTFDYVSTGEAFYTVVLGSRITAVGVDFLNTLPASVHGFKFLDINNNGMYDPNDGETGLPGIQFRLTGIDGRGVAIDEIAVTGADGEFDFEGLFPSIIGDATSVANVLSTGYTVEEIVPPGYTPTTATSFGPASLAAGVELVVFEGQSTPLYGVPEPAVFPFAVDNLFPISPPSIVAQRFATDFGGLLADGFLLIGAQSANDIAGAIVELQTLDGSDNPSGVVLASTTISSADIFDGDTRLTPFSFGAGAPLIEAGTPYAIVVRSDTVGEPLVLAGGSTNPFSPRGGLFSGDNGGTWAPGLNGGVDFFLTARVRQRVNGEIFPINNVGNALSFGNTVNGSLHGFKFEDVDGNRQYDGGPAQGGVDLPLAGVTFSLTGTLADGTQVVRQTTTDGTGNFEFTNLPPSIDGVGLATGYRLEEQPLLGFIATVGEAFDFDLPSGVEFVWQAGASDVDPNNPDELRTEEIDTRLLFGNTAPGSIHGFKFEDVDGNGVYDDMIDAPLGGVIFEIIGDVNGDGVTDVVPTTSDATTGEFAFIDLYPGQYTVRELEPLPTGFVATTGPLERTFTINSRQELVWRDSAAALPLPPVATLDQSQTEDPSFGAFFSTTSNRAQNFVPSVSGGLTQVTLSVNNFSVANEPVTVEIQSVDLAGVPTGNVLGTAVTQVAPGVEQTIAFEFAPALTLVANQTYSMVIRSNLPGLDFSVIGSSGNVYPAGQYWFSNDSGVSWAELNGDLLFTTTMLPNADPRFEVLDDPDQNGIGETLVWGNTVPGSIHGFKFEDVNGNGIYEQGELGQPGVTFTLTGTDGLGRPVDRTTRTGINGEFEFVGLFPSNEDGYLLTEVVPGGYVATTPRQRTFVLDSRNEFVWVRGAAGLGDNDPREEMLATQIPTNLFGEELLFGNVVPGSIHGFKFLDADADGIFDQGVETGLANIPFQLTGINSLGDPVDITVLTDADGEFDFENLFPSVAGQPSAVPGVLQTGYTVTELVPPLFPATTPITFTVDIRSGEEFVARPGQSTPILGTRLDLLQPVSDTILLGSDTLVLGQTFVPTVTGPLASVALGFDSVAVVDPVSDILVEIRAIDTNTGLPTGPVLAASSIAPDALAVSGQETFIDFTSPATLQAGTAYAIIVRSATGTTNFRLAASNLNPFGGGTAIVSVDGGATFITIPGTDLVFATFMTQRINNEIVVGDEQFVGNTLNGSIHGLKFEDINGNGVFDGTDVPLAGVTFVLTGTLADGTVIVRQTSTGADGEFDFTDLPPSVAGNDLATGYFLEEVVPPGFAATTNTAAFFNIEPGQEYVYATGSSDIDPQNPADPRVEVLRPGLLTYGNTVPGSIHGFKFEDVNGNGIYEPNLQDVPQPNVTFTLSGIDGLGNPVQLETTTDANGQFWFVGLFPSVDGTPTGSTVNPTATGYTVTETLPTGFVESTGQTNPNVSRLARRFDLESRQELAWTIDAAMLTPFLQPQVDQVQDSGLNSLYVGGDRIQAQSFTPSFSGTLNNVSINVNPAFGTFSDYTMEIFAVDALGIPTGAALASSTLTVAQVLAGGENLSFGFGTPALLTAGTTYAMVLSSPATDPLAGGINWRLSPTDTYGGGNAILSSEGFPFATDTDIDFRFVTVMSPAEPRIAVDLGDELVWGNTLPGEIHGFKFNDLDGDGIVDPGEPRLGGFVINLLNDSGQIVATETTDDNGEYWFVDLRPGTYFVREVQQAGYAQTTHDPQPIVIDRGEVYVAVAGQAMLQPDDAREVIVEKCLIFGNTLTASIFGLKFNDLDRNGNDNGGTDPRVAGVTITLTGDSDGDGTTDVQTRVTDANGQFSFQNIRPGTYTLTETPPPGSVATTPVSRTVTLAAGQIAVSVASQAGVLAPVQTLSVRGAELSFGNSYTGEIRGIKFEDLDGNGIADPADPALAGFTIQLVNATGTVIATDITDAQGRYEFLNLMPGTYFVREVQQAGFEQTTHDPQPIAITAGQIYVGRANLVQPNPDDRREIVVDKCLLFGNTLTASIYGYKFNDRNADGDDEAGTDPRLAGVTITLTGDSDGDGTTDIQTRTTDASGQFSFVNIRPGTYTLTETPPAGSTATTPTSRTVTLAAGQIAVALASQAGALAPVQTLSVRGAALTFGNTFPGEFEGFKFQDRDGDGQYDPQSGERGMVDVQFVLTGIDGQGNTINRTTFTGPDGVFRFANLLPSVAGNPTPVAGVTATGYTITEIVPVGAVATTLPISRTFNLLSGATLSFTQQVSTPSGGQTVVDQQQTVSTAAVTAPVAGGNVAGQTFRPSISGQLTTVQIRVSTTGAIGNTVLQVQTVDAGGAPTGTVLGSATLTAAQIPVGTDLPVTFTFPTPINLNAEQPYALVLLAGGTAGSVVGPEVDNGTTIDNDFSVGTLGYFSAPVGDGGDFRNNGVTVVDTNGALLQDQDFVFDYFTYVQFGQTTVRLANTTVTQAATLIADDVVESRGNFQGPNGQVNWIVTTSIGDGSGRLNTRVDLNAAAGTMLGDIRVINYLDEDVFSVSDDFLYTVGTPGQADFRAFTIDQPQRVGFSHGGIYSNDGTNQINASYLGWTADEYSDLRTTIGNSGAVFSIPGNINTTSLPPFTDSQVGSAFGPEDITTAFGWAVDPTAGSARVTAFLELLASNPTSSLSWRSSGAVDAYARGNATSAAGAAVPGFDMTFITTMTTVGGQDDSLYWGNRLPGEIHGIKFHDLNGDGVFGIGEPTLAGFEIQLINQAGTVVDTVTTNAQGEYWFLDVDPGTYFVREVQQRGFFQTTHDPQPISITGGQIYVGRGDLVMQLDDVREIIVDKCLNFGNQLRGEITWTKVNKNNQLLGGVIFELVQTHSYNLATGALTNTPDVVITVADNLIPDVNPTGGLFQVNDLPLGRYTLRESMPIPGYDPDLRVATFELYPQQSLNDRFQESPIVFVNTWSKRAYVGSTYAARLAYLAEFARAEVEFVNGGVADFFGNPNNGGGGGGGLGGEPFRVGIQLAEGESTVELIHRSSGTVVGEGELVDEFDLQTTDYDEYLVVGSMPRMTGPLRISVGGGDDVIEIENFNFASLNGGDGRDVLRIRQSGDLSLDAIVNLLSGLEEIDLAGPDQRLNLTSSMASRLGGEQPLRVRTNASDQLELSEPWTLERVLRDGADVIQQIRSGSTLVNVINNNRWQNVLNRFDVNGDGVISARDALVGINQINRGTGLSTDDLPENFFDVNGDGRVSAVDVLQIINRLNVQDRSRGEAIAPPAATPSPWTADPIEQASASVIDSLTDDDDVVAIFSGGSTSHETAALVSVPSGSDWNAGDDDEDEMLSLLAGDLGR